MVLTESLLVSVCPLSLSSVCRVESCLVVVGHWRKLLILPLEEIVPALSPLSLSCVAFNISCYLPGHLPLK